MKWNDKQRKVLDSIALDRNILVSAAAGSGKTAVLVERIVNSVAEGRCGIDEVLVVTFTKAAAAQMKGKIIAEMEKRAYATQNARLIRQLSVAPNADISTIDSFCNRVVRENFQMAGIDPAYGVFDSGEEALLFEEILDEVLNRLYEDPEFAGFARAFTRKTYKDEYLRDLILSTFRVSEAFADPDKWLDSCRSEYWQEKYLEEIQKKAAVAEADLSAEIAFYVAETDPDSVKYAEKIADVLQADVDIYRKLKKAKKLTEVAGAFAAKAPAFRGNDYCKAYDEDQIADLAARKKAYREDLREMVKDISEDAIKAEEADHEVVIRNLIRAVRMFRDALMEEKRRRKKYSFSDIAHFAYGVLFDREKGEVTPIARNYAERYRYIYIDEYQDGSDIQEHILNSVARFSKPKADDEARPAEPCNIFMVGDVKQSIYRFRQARPQLFLEKERDYNSKVRAGEVLYLNQNFRSRREILDATNFVFRHLMREEFGGITYNEDVQLNVPDEYTDPVDPEQLPEILLCEAGAVDENEVPVEKDVLEARMIGKRILSLVEEKTQIRVKNEAFDKSRPEGPENSRTILRPVRFGDIVILQSVVKKVGHMLREYEKMGIPVQLEDPKAYFDAEEVIITLSILQLIDNARQDIPYAAVLHSPIVGCDDTELAYLALHRTDRAQSLYDAACDWLEDRETDQQDGFSDLADALALKLERFHARIENWKKESVYLSISQLLDRILEQTGFRETAARMPRGERRLNNLTQLFFKAEAFEQAGNHGLFAFLQYIEKCRIHEEEFAGRGSLSEATDSVRICTIHSSKGLEYPVVFVSRLGREFNRKAYENMVTVSADYGLAPNRIRKIGGKYWLSVKGIRKRAVNHLMIMEDLHEQLRLLYVAMTRAEQRLFLTAVGTEVDALNDEEVHGSVSYTSLVKAKSYLDFLYAILQADYDGAKEFFRIRQVPTEELVGQESVDEEDETEEAGTADIIEINEADKTDNADVASDDMEDDRNFSDQAHSLAEKLRGDYDFRYEYEAAVITKTKLSVSEIKHEAHKVQESDHSQDSQDPIRQTALIEPKTKKNRKIEITGAEYGTAVHKLMELLPFEAIDSAKDMRDALKELIGGPHFTEALRKILHVGKIGKFYSDEPESLFRRMKRAAGRGELFREQQFLVGLPGRRLGQEIPVRDAVAEDLPEPRISEEDARERIDETSSGTSAKRFDTDEAVALQGVIDAFFLETDPEGHRYVVLMDYKTDKVDSPEELVQRYRAQLSLYKETIESILQLPVREMWLYGFADGLGEIQIF
ncbi:MAG: helicase-exonuclease AddAB subunit AddA [Eubacterium sp.]|nr:helicase-exonuclease AddAB subunit AddA [Eubacterium sp.]